MGREPKTVQKSFVRPNGHGLETLEKNVELFTWEKLDMVEAVKAAFGL